MIGSILRKGIFLICALASTGHTASLPRPSVASCVGLASWASSQCNVRAGSTPEECELVRDETESTCNSLEQAGNATHFVTVRSDGSFAPNPLTINDGDTVIWSFLDRNESIVPIEHSGPIPTILTSGISPICSSYKPYVAEDLNEFIGPMPRAASGIFLLNRQRETGNTEILDAFDPALQSLDFTGVSLRLKWSDIHLGPGEFDWAYLDHLIEQVVDNGKLFSLVIKAGQKKCLGSRASPVCDGVPEWIFDTSVTGASAAKSLLFQDTGSFPSVGECGINMTLGSPADANYRMHYFELLEAVAAHLKEKNFWYQSLAYIKPSGANLTSPEARLPNRCWSNTHTGLTSDKCDCNEPTTEMPNPDNPCICNPQIWSQEGNYTPESLYQYFSMQNAILTRVFPEKDLSYMLIQAGFPLINNAGEYEGQDIVDEEGNYRSSLDPTLTPSLPEGTEQTKEILRRGAEEHGPRFIVQHNALRGSREANTCVTNERDRGQLTGYQTTNDIEDQVMFGDTLANALGESAIFLEVYQKNLLDNVDPAAIFGQHTLDRWADEFHRVRRKYEYLQIAGDPFPFLHGHTFEWAWAEHGQSLPINLRRTTRDMNRSKKHSDKKHHIKKGSMKWRMNPSLSLPLSIKRLPLVLKYIVMPHCRTNAELGEIIITPPP